MKFSSIMITVLSLSVTLGASAASTFWAENQTTSTIRVCAFDANDGLKRNANTEAKLFPSTQVKLRCQGQGEQKCWVRMVPGSYGCDSLQWPTRKINKDGRITITRWNKNNPKGAEFTIND